MIRSLWIARTGLDAQQTSLDVIANNLANTSTNGFKRARPVFEDLLYQTLRQPGASPHSRRRFLAACSWVLVCDPYQPRAFIPRDLSSRPGTILTWPWPRVPQVLLPDGTGLYPGRLIPEGQSGAGRDLQWLSLAAERYDPVQCPDRHHLE